jgi:hypothetical protein
MGKEVTGKAKGAMVLAEKMTTIERKARAQKGGFARWKKHITASHKGNFVEQLGLDVECYVLNDVAKTPVISQTGMARALGMASRGSVFPRFISSKVMSDFIGIELRKKLENPVKFQWDGGGIGQPTITVFGFDAALLIDVCSAIAEANAAGKFSSRYNNIINNAAIITGASAKSGIRNLIYALAGYSPSTQEVIEAFKAYVLEEAKKYEKEFPMELYVEWQRLYDITPPQRGKNWKEMHLTVDHVYYPLAKSNGKLLELLRSAKTSGGDRGKKLFQFLNEVGARALRMQLGRVLEMAESSPDKHAYEEKIIQRFGGQLSFNIPTYPIS